MSKHRPSYVIAIALTVFFSLGCWEQVSPEWFAQMKEQPALQAQEGIQPLMPPEGTVPVGGIAPRITGSHPMAAMPMFAPEVKDLANPVAADAASIARGEKMYGIYCELCHADDGMASPDKTPIAGLLAKSGAPPFPLSTTVAYSDGQLYTKIRYGKPLMPGYPQIPSDDRWHIVNYLRTLFKKG
ncbi:MAG: hypothetical protein GY725_02130 [bacterium]|nr:hypothetical protein [bacterium]